MESDKPCIDSGTTLILLPTASADEYYNQIPASKYDNLTDSYLFPCVTDLPDLNITFGNAYSTIVPGKDLWQDINGTCKTLLLGLNRGG